MSSKRSNASLEAAGTATKPRRLIRDPSSDDDSEKEDRARSKQNSRNRVLSSRIASSSQRKRRDRPEKSASQPSTSKNADKTAHQRGKKMKVRSSSEFSSMDSSEEELPMAGQRSGRAKPGPSTRRAPNHARNKSGARAISSDESEEEAPHRSQTGRQGTLRSSQSQSRPKGRPEMFLMERPSDDSMRDALLHYILVRQNKSTVFLRKDFIREPLMGIKDMYMDTLKEVKTILQKVFLLQLVGFERSSSSQLDGWDSYILIGKVPFSVLCDPERVETISLSQKFLVIILEIIFMTGIPMDIETMWSVMTELEFDEELCPEFGDFEKFLKNEYVSKQYLYLREFTEVRGKRNKATYEWGMRSQYEFSKLKMLKSVAEKFNIQDLKIFSHAYTNAKKQVAEYGSGKEKDELREMEAALPPIDESMIEDNENEYVNSLMQSVLESPYGDGIIGYENHGTQGSRVLSSSKNPDDFTQSMEVGDDTEESD